MSAIMPCGHESDYHVMSWIECYSNTIKKDLGLVAKKDNDTNDIVTILDVMEAKEHLSHVTELYYQGDMDWIDYRNAYDTLEYLKEKFFTDRGL